MAPRTKSTATTPPTRAVAPFVVAPSVVAPFGVEPPEAAGVDLFTVEMGKRAFAVVSFPLPAQPPRRARLSPAETAVARLAVAGRSNREIAHARGSSERTVANQMASLFRKLGVRSRSELAAYATWFAADLGSPPGPAVTGP